MLKFVITIFTCYLISSAALAETVDVLFIYTPDGEADFIEASASEEDVMLHVNQNFFDAGTGINFRKVGSYLMENYQENYYGDGIYEDFNDTQQMHFDLLTAGDKTWVKDAREKRKIYGADIVLFIAGNADVEPDAGGQGPGAFLGRDGGYLLVPGQYAWDEPIFSHEIQHIFGMSHEEMDSGDISDLFDNAYAVEHFEDRTSNAYLWSDDFSGPSSETEVLNYLGCDTIDDQQSSWSSSDYLNAIAFYNQSNVTLDVFWIDYSGAEVRVATLSPGQTHGVSTASQHPWFVRNAQFPYECVGGVINKGQNYENLYLNSRY